MYMLCLLHSCLPVEMVGKSVQNFDECNLWFCHINNSLILVSAYNKHERQVIKQMEDYDVGCKMTLELSLHALKYQQTNKDA